MNTRRQHLFYSVSFATVVIQIGCLLLLIFTGAVRSGTLSFRHLAQFWLASAVIGLTCAVFGGGDLTKQPSASPGVLGLVLNGGLLALLGILYAVSFVHD